MRRRAGYRKGNYAVFVKINMSTVAEAGTSLSGLYTQKYTNKNAG